MDADLKSPPAQGVTADELDPSRAAALDAWRERNPSAVTDRGALREAAFRATLVDTVDGPRFDGSFGELVEFIAELPF